MQDYDTGSIVIGEEKKEYKLLKRREHQSIPHIYDDWVATRLSDNAIVLISLDKWSEDKPWFEYD